MAITSSSPIVHRGLQHQISYESLQWLKDRKDYLRPGDLDPDAITHKELDTITLQALNEHRKQRPVRPANPNPFTAEILVPNIEALIPKPSPDSMGIRPGMQPFYGQAKSSPRPVAVNEALPKLHALEEKLREQNDAQILIVNEGIARSKKFPPSESLTWASLKWGRDKEKRRFLNANFAKRRHYQILSTPIELLRQASTMRRIEDAASTGSKEDWDKEKKAVREKVETKLGEPISSDSDSESQSSKKRKRAASAEPIKVSVKNRVKFRTF